MALFSTRTVAVLSVAGLVVAGALGAALISVSNGQCSDGSFRTEYFGNVDLSGDPVLVRCEPDIVRDWQLDGPRLPLGQSSGGAAVAGDYIVGEDGFSIRWVGRHEFLGGTYVFTAGSDDGIRVWVDDRLLIDAWADSPYDERSAKVELPAGVHPIRVEYYERIGNATVRLAWEPLS